MHLDALLWLFLPVFVAGGSALLSFYIMQAKMEVSLSKERESLAEAHATISSQKVMMEERIRATEESVKRAALDEFLKDFRVEERSYVRETKSLESEETQHDHAGTPVFPQYSAVRLGGTRNGGRGGQRSEAAARAGFRFWRSFFAGGFACGFGWRLIYE